MSLSGFFQSSFSHPGIKFPAYLNIPLCLLLLLFGALKRRRVNTYCASSPCTVFQSVSMSLPASVNVTVNDTQ